MIQRSAGRALSRLYTDTIEPTDPSMSDTHDYQTRASTYSREAVPTDKRPGHERRSGDDPVVEMEVEDGEGNEWFTVGNGIGVVCTLDPVDVRQ